MAEAAADVDAAVFSPALAVADAVMYEGYLLYPYRRSAAKNQVRWQFGVLTPRDWAQAHGTARDGVAGAAESWWQQTECLVQAPPDATVAVRVRFLQLQRRLVSERTTGGGFRPVPELLAGPRRELAFDEAVPQSFDLAVKLGALRLGGREFPLRAPGSHTCETVTDPAGQVAGLVVRSRRPVAAQVQLSAAGLPEAPGLCRLRLRIANAGSTPDPALPRDEVLACSLISTHSMLALDQGSFLSLLEPPPWAEPASRGCHNVRTFPVLAGDAAAGTGRDRLTLSAPIILSDHPRIAPESPGDLHDATEIDELLTLRALTLTDSEKSEARATDPRAADILDRVETMPPAVLARLHGAIRSGDQPAESLTIGHASVSRGSRVRLRPRMHGTDPQDMFLAGKTAMVEAVLSDVDGARHLAVTVEDDPGADLHRWYGRFRYFGPDEVEPLPAAGFEPHPGGGKQ